MPISIIFLPFVNEQFPHPNTNIQNGHTYVPVFLDTFPEVKESIRKWANNNLDQLNCENVQREIKTNIIPNIYRTYLDDCDSSDNPLSLEDFLYLSWAEENWSHHCLEVDEIHEFFLQ